MIMVNTTGFLVSQLIILNNNKNLLNDVSSILKHHETSRFFYKTLSYFFINDFLNQSNGITLKDKNKTNDNSFRVNP